MRIRIIGSGSIGMLLAGKLSLRGSAEVELVTKTESQAEAIRAKGICIREGSFCEAAPKIRLSSFEQLQAVQSVRPDWVFLTVKQRSIDDSLLTCLEQSAFPSNGFLCWQNGIGHIERLASVIPGELLYIAVTTEGARRLGLAEVSHTGSGTTTIGRAFISWNEPIGKNGEASMRINPEAAEKKLLDALQSAGFAAVMSKQIHNAVWNKLLVNSAINPLSAVLRVTNGDLLSSEASLSLMRQLVKEAASVAQAEGIYAVDDIWERVTEVCRRTAGNRSSMLQDIENGTLTENEWISGGLIRLAKRHSLHLPVTETIYRIVQALERGK